MQHWLQEIGREAGPMFGEAADRKPVGIAISAEVCAGFGERAVDHGCGSIVEGMRDGDGRLDPLEAVIGERHRSEHG